MVTEQKLLEILNQLSNGGSAVQVYITNALTDKTTYSDFITDRKIGRKSFDFSGRIRILFFLATMIRLYCSEYLADEYSRLPEAFFVQSLMTDSASNSLIPFDTGLQTMLDEIMMWCVIAHLPEDLVRFLLSLLPESNFKVRKSIDL